MSLSSDTDTEVLAHLIALMNEGSAGERGERSAEAGRRHLRPRRHRRGARRCAGGRPQRQPDRARARRRGKCCSPRMPRPSCGTPPASSISTTARWRRCAPTASRRARLDGDQHGQDAVGHDLEEDEAFDKGGQGHYMRKEIADQPEALRRDVERSPRRALPDTHLGGLALESTRPPGRPPRQDPGLRLGLHRGYRRRASHRAAGAAAGPGGARLPSSAIAIR